MTSIPRAPSWFNMEERTAIALDASRDVSNDVGRLTYLGVADIVSEATNPEFLADVVANHRRLIALGGAGLHSGQLVSELLMDRHSGPPETWLRELRSCQRKAASAYLNRDAQEYPGDPPSSVRKACWARWAEAAAAIEEHFPGIGPVEKYMTPKGWDELEKLAEAFWAMPPEYRVERRAEVRARYIQDIEELLSQFPA